MILYILLLNYHVLFFFNHTYCSNILYFKDLSSLSWKHTISLLLCDLEILYFKCVHWKTVPFFPMTQSCFYSQCKYDLTSRHVKRWGIVLQGEMLVQLHRLPLSCGNRQPSYEIVCLVNGTTRVELMSFWKWKFVSWVHYTISVFLCTWPLLTTRLCMKWVLDCTFATKISKTKYKEKE